MHVNNETGNIFPVSKISQICKSKGIHFHCDAVQSFGKNILNIESIDCDSISISEHKIGALNGIGALIVKDTINIHPLFFGGSQEKGSRYYSLKQHRYWGLKSSGRQFKPDT